MSFLNGAVTARRFSTDPFGLPSEEHVAALGRYPASLRWNPDGRDDVTYAWTGGLDRLDATFSPDKQVRGEFLTFGFLVTTRKPPADLLKARTRVELAALVAAGQKENARTRREAKQAAIDSLTDDAKDGRFDRFTHVPVVVDCERGEVWFGHASHSHVPAFLALFAATFGVEEPSQITPNYMVADVPEYPGDAPAWVADGEAGDAWGTQWAMSVVKGAMSGTDLFPGRGGDVTLMPHKSLAMMCPAAGSGDGTYRHDMPHRMPEAVRAAAEGKLPHTLGLAMSWTGLAEPVTFSVRPHDWVVTGADVAEPDDADRAVREAGRLLACREFFDELDGVLARYLKSLQPDVVTSPHGHQPQE